MTGSTISIILISVSFALLIFALAYIIVATIMADRIAAEKRLEELNKKEGVASDVALVKNESRSSKRKAMRKKQKSKFSEQFGNAIYKELQSADIKMRPEEFMIVWVVAMFVPGGLVSLFWGNAVVALALVVAGIIIPVAYVKMKQNSRIKKFEEQLSDALMICTSCLRSGLSFTQAMETIARDMDAPISTEFDTAVKELNMGYSLEEALENMGERIPSRFLSLMISAVLVQRQTGGNLSHILENISYTIKEKMKLKKQLRTATASGRTSGTVVGIMPVALLVIFSLLNYDMEKVLFTEPRGYALLGGVALLEGLAFLTIKKITTIKM